MLFYEYYKLQNNPVLVLNTYMNTTSNIMPILFYRPRKVYTYDPEKSCEGCDPDKDILTFPNIPYWTGMNGARKLPSGFKRRTVLGYVTGTGLATPFIKVSLSELLWGYQDELPCLKMQDKKPKECDR